jgi:probable phosphoglycerate mutase
MKIIITRHGQTEGSVAGILQGHIPGALTKVGKEEARKVALRLKNEKIDIIYSSDLKRAVDTTKEIIKLHQNTPVKYVEELREMYLGEYQGKHISGIEIKYKNSKSQIIEASDGEKANELYERAKKFFKYLIKHHSDEAILIVGHNGINIALMTVILEKKWTDLLNFYDTHTASISIFESKRNKSFKTILFDSTDHLK